MRLTEGFHHVRPSGLLFNVPPATPALRHHVCWDEDDARRQRGDERTIVHLAEDMWACMVCGRSHVCGRRAMMQRVPPYRRRTDVGNYAKLFAPDPCVVVLNDQASLVCVYSGCVIEDQVYIASAANYDEYMDQKETLMTDDWNVDMISIELANARQLAASQRAPSEVIANQRRRALRTAEENWLAQRDYGFMRAAYREAMRIDQQARRELAIYGGVAVDDESSISDPELATLPTSASTADGSSAHREEEDDEDDTGGGGGDDEYRDQSLREESHHVPYYLAYHLDKEIIPGIVLDESVPNNAIATLRRPWPARDLHFWAAVYFPAIHATSSFFAQLPPPPPHVAFRRATADEAPAAATTTTKSAAATAVSSARSRKRDRQQLVQDLVSSMAPPPPPPQQCKTGADGGGGGGGGEPRPVDAVPRPRPMRNFYLAHERLKRARWRTMHRMLAAMIGEHDSLARLSHYWCTRTEQLMRRCVVYTLGPQLGALLWPRYWAVLRRWAELLATMYPSTDLRPIFAVVAYFGYMERWLDGRPFALNWPKSADAPPISWLILPPIGGTAHDLLQRVDWTVALAPDDDTRAMLRRGPNALADRKRTRAGGPVKYIFPPFAADNERYTMCQYVATCEALERAITVVAKYAPWWLWQWFRVK